MKVDWGQGSAKPGDSVDVAGEADGNSANVHLYIYTATDMGPSGPNPDTSPVWDAGGVGSDGSLGFGTTWQIPSSACDGAGFVAYAVEEGYPLEQAATATSNTLTVSVPPPPPAPTPSVSGLSPTSSDPSGTTSVTISGENLGSITGVAFGPSCAIPVTPSSDGRTIQVDVPTGANQGDVPVVLQGDPSGDVSAGTFTFTPAPAPTPATPSVSGLSPTSSDPSGQTSVTITGGSLGSVTGVAFGQNPAIAVTPSPDGTTIQVTVTTGPQDSGDVPVVLQGDPSGDVNAGTFTFAAAPAAAPASPSNLQWLDQPGGNALTSTDAGSDVTVSFDLAHDDQNTVGVAILGSDQTTQVADVSASAVERQDQTGFTAPWHVPDGGDGYYFQVTVNNASSPTPGTPVLSGELTVGDPPPPLRDYYYAPDEGPVLQYIVVANPPPADSGECQFHGGSPDGPLLKTTDNLATTGSAKLQVDLSGLTAKTDSPVFLEFVFKKQGHEDQSKSPVAIALAEPAPATIDVPANAKPGDQVTLQVTGWSAIVYDTPGQGTAHPETDTSRIPQSALSAVKWKVGDTELPDQGQQIAYTIPDGALGTLDVQAYLDATADTPARGSIALPAGSGVTSLQVPGTVASGAETVQIQWAISDALAVLTGAKLELYANGMDQPVWTQQLSADQYADGAHQLDWDGKIDAGQDAFPDGYATIEYSPYTLQITVTGSNPDAVNPAVQKATVNVDVASFSVALADKAVLTTDQDKAVYDQLAGKIPANDLNVQVDVKLDSNNFIRSDMDIYTADLPFEAHRLKWAGGPRIPLVATCKVRDSAGNETISAVALGKARVLWHSKDVSDTTGTLNAKPAAFAQPVAQFGGADTRPDGVSAHVSFGGKRGSKADSPGLVLEAPQGDAIQNFPYDAAAGDVRWWETFSPFLRDDAHKGTAGVVLRASRMGADAYMLSAYLETATKKLDVDDALDPLQQANIVNLRIVRSATISSVTRKNASVSYAVPKIDDYYEAIPFFIEDATGGTVTDMTQAEFDAALGAALGDRSVTSDVADKEYLKYGVPSGVSHWNLPALPHTWGNKANTPGTPLPDPGDPTSWLLTIYGYGDFKARLKAGIATSGGRAGDADLASAMDSRTDGSGATPFRGKRDLQSSLAFLGAATEMDYSINMSRLAGELGGLMVQNNYVTRKGISVVQFRHATSMSTKGPRLQGQAVYKPTDNTDGDQTGFLIFENDSEVMAHEIGHCLGFSHAKEHDNDIPVPAGNQPDRHDANDDYCLMSYHYRKHGKRDFCGLCALRLRGYRGDRFNASGILPNGDIKTPPVPEDQRVAGAIKGDGDDEEAGSSEPCLTSIAPTSGEIGGGTAVTIQGMNLSSVTAVAFQTSGDASPAMLTIDQTQSTDTRIVGVTSAHGPGPVDVVFLDASGSSTGSPGVGAFTYGAAPPQNLRWSDAPFGGELKMAAPGDRVHLAFDLQHVDSPADRMKVYVLACDVRYSEVGGQARGTPQDATFVADVTASLTEHGPAQDVAGGDPGPLRRYTAQWQLPTADQLPLTGLKGAPVYGWLTDAFYFWVTRDTECDPVLSKRLNVDWPQDVHDAQVRDIISELIVHENKKPSASWTVNDKLNDMRDTDLLSGGWALRVRDSENTVLRDAEYYIVGRAKINQAPRLAFPGGEYFPDDPSAAVRLSEATAGVALNCFYNALKAVLPDEVMRTDPDKPNARVTTGPVRWNIAGIMDAFADYKAKLYNKRVPVPDYRRIAPTGWQAFKWWKTVESPDAASDADKNDVLGNLGR